MKPTSSDTVESLREALASMEAQLASLYEDKQRQVDAGWGGNIDESLAALYEDKQRLSARRIADLQASVDSMSEQLAHFYAGGEGHDYGQASKGETAAMLNSLTQQLHAIYEEREGVDSYADSGVGDVRHLMSTLESLEEQLASLYEEREGHECSHSEAMSMIESLTTQVAVLLEERNDLAEECSRLAAQCEATRARAREMVDALVSRALA